MATGQTRQFYVRLGGRLRSSRIRAGLSQAALGKRLGRSASAIDRYEMGQRRIAVADLVRLAEILRVSIHAFLGGANPTRPPLGTLPTPGPHPADRLHAEHLRLLRALDRRLFYPDVEDRPGRVAEAPRTYGGRLRSGGGPSSQPSAATLPVSRLRAWARRAGLPLPADPGVLRRYANLILAGLPREAGRKRRRAAPR